MSIQSAVAPFEFFWASPEGKKLYTPKQQQLFMVQIGAPAGYDVANPLAPNVSSVLPSGFYAEDAQGDAIGLENKVDQSLKGYIWFAKGINKPELTFPESSPSQLRAFNDLRSYRPIRLESAPMYTPITLRMIDPTSPNPTRKLLNLLRMSGLGSEDLGGNIAASIGERHDRGFDDVLSSAFLDPVRIYQYGHLPNADPFEPRGRLYLLEKWELVDPKVNSLNFGELDYSSEDFVEITLTLTINGFKCTTYDVPGPGGATAQKETVFKSVKNSI